MPFQTSLMNIKNYIWYFVGNTLKWSWSFQLISRFKPGISVASCEKLLCIEGYPRSGNTFLFAICCQLISKEKIAHHLHNCAQIKASIQCGVPVLFVARSPLDAICSYIIREDISYSRAIDQYLSLYSYVAQNFSLVQVIEFDEVVSNPQQTAIKVANLLKINASDISIHELKREVSAMDMSDQKSDAVNPLKVGLPTEEKRKLKQVVMAELKEAFHEEIKKCEDTYERIIN
jgi:hypothetical protein